jgi:peptide deformylase
MIVTSLEVLKIKSRDTSVEECHREMIFERMDDEIKKTQGRGIGLSAVQIGVHRRACAIRIPEQKRQDGSILRSELILDMINPVILEAYDPIIFQNEGCLSMPGVSVDTDRYNHIVAKWLDYNLGEERTATFSGIEAVCIQQEIAHCEGKLITDFRHKKVESVGRNDACPCGSGRKYKKCCLK